MAWRLDSIAMRRLLVLASALVLVVAACSGSSDTADTSVDTNATTAAIDTTAPEVPASTGTAGPTAKDVSTTSASNADDATGEGKYSVLMLGNVDELTASNTLRSLEEAGFEGFIMEGTAEEGFDLYRPGLTYDEANDVLVEILLAPGVNGGLIFETVNLP